MQIADKLQLIATKEIPEVHYDLDHKGKQATLTELGLQAAYLKLGRRSLQLPHLIQDLKTAVFPPCFTFLIPVCKATAWRIFSFPFLSFPFLSFPFLSCPVLSCPFLSCPAF